ncbi:MAG: phasin family protein [Hyphomicrobiaceae bacterium]|nr:phasin family protein [Hyphomicrobiaceae bacterium]
MIADLRVPENVAVIAQQGVAQSREFFARGTAAAQDGARAVTEIADTAWGSTKMLHEKLAQNAQATAEAAFAAAAAIAAAKSLPEIARLQHEFLQSLSAQTQEQTKEFFDLSARATQHVLEKVQAVATKALKPGA